LRNKKGINRVSRITFDNLIPDEDSQNWYIYDDESISYLLSSEKVEYTKNENNVIIKNRNEFYFQDKGYFIDLSMKEHKQILMTIIVNKDVNCLFIPSIPQK
jgi:hypothetical protein